MATVVLPRTFPDLDGVACAVGYAEFLGRTGVGALPWIPTEGDSEAEFVLRRCSDVSFANPADFGAGTTFVLVDASDLEGLPAEVDPLRIVEVIDHRHHANPERAFPHARVVIEPVGAAATIIAERFQSARIEPSRSSQQLLFGAIHSNTQRLQGSVVTERDRTAAIWLQNMGVVNARMLDEQFAARKDYILSRLEESVVRESKRYSDGVDEYVVAQLEFEGARGLVNYSRNRLVTALGVLGPCAMLNLVDVADGSSVLLVLDPKLQTAVAERLGALCRDGLFVFTPAVLRKQIVAALLRRNPNKEVPQS